MSEESVARDLFDRWERVWFRFTLTWTYPSTGETRTRAGMQLYRVETGKLASGTMS